jgi:AGCS family alanine or glycine:cation symporter
MINLIFQGESSDAGVSSFQALAISLSGRVGTGNIAGVATAIAMGGPGAVFWMWLVAFLGASTAFVEATLAQIYKEKDDNGMYRGGPAYFIEKAMGKSGMPGSFRSVPSSLWAFACLGFKQIVLLQPHKMPGELRQC